jgi:DNA-binding LytR/AlgR family response regulator
MEKPAILILEDEFVIAEDIRTCLEKNDYNVAGVFDKGESVLDFVKDGTTVDLMLVDIKLAGALDGIQTVQRLQSRMLVPIVFITANSDHETYARAKNTRPHAFLIKPFTHANLLATVDLALYNFFMGSEAKKIERPPVEVDAKDVLINQYLFVRSNNRYRKIHCDDILFAEAAGSYVHVQTADQRYILSQNLTHFQKKSPLPNFLRIHRSYIINLNKVDSFEESHVYIASHKLPLSDTHRADFLRKVHLL